MTTEKQHRPLDHIIKDLRAAEAEQIAAVRKVDSIKNELRDLADAAQMARGYDE